jgi:hypothetical protein
VTIDRDREYPREGADGMRALTDTAIIYAESFPKSALARDPLYLFGDPNAPLPPEPPATPPAPEDDPHHTMDPTAAQAEGASSDHA